MSQNTQWDSLDYDVLNFPYDRISTEFSQNPRIFRGQNSYVTYGGKLAKRPGTINLDSNNTITGRIDRIWLYETLESTAKVYLIASVFTGTFWELKWKRMGSTVTAWQSATSYRDSNASTRPHTFTTSRGLAYVKSYPAGGSSEKLGTIILDGTSGSIVVKPWGILGPQTPARIKGAITLIAADITATATTLTVDSDTGFPAVPFYIQVGYEQMQVTAGLPGTSWTVTRGVNGTLADTHEAGEPVIWANWSVSDHLVEVNIGWKYVYAYKTSTGQISNRSPLETNPDRMPSTTGPFFDLCPEIIVQGHADTTNIPTICIYRSTDGGGTYYKLEEIANTGAGNITYKDDSLESGSGGGTYNDPLPDAVLDQSDLAPSLFSNSPPPAVLAPLVTGVDTPAATSPIVNFQSRIWYAIGNILFFSAQEELNEGIPEESFPSGAQNGRNGNFYRFQYPIVNLQETAESLYIFTTNSTYRITGSNLETFDPSPVFENIGGLPGHPRAVTRYGSTVAFLSHDYRVCLVQGNNIETLSDPLWTDIVDAANSQAEFELRYFADLDKEWLVVSAHRPDLPANSRHWVFDIRKSQTERKPFWFTPWTIQSVVTISTRAIETSSQRRLVFAIYDTVSNATALVRMDPTGRTPTDYIHGTESGFTFNIETHQMLVPAGNHVNSLRIPGLTPTVYGVNIDRILTPGDNDPDVYCYFDDLWTDPLQIGRVENPPRRSLSKGYKTLIYTIHRACQHFALRITKLNSTDLFEVSRITVIWNPDAGA